MTEYQEYFNHCVNNAQDGRVYEMMLSELIRLALLDYEEVDYLFSVLVSSKWPKLANIGDAIDLDGYVEALAPYRLEIINYMPLREDYREKLLEEANERYHDLYCLGHTDPIHGDHVCYYAGDY